MTNQWSYEDAWQLADTVGKAYALIADLSENIAARTGISTSHMVALAVLDGFPDGLTQTAWGKYQGVSRQRASVVCKALEAENLIHNRPDGRSVVVTLSSQGEKRIRHYKKLFGGAIQSKLDGLSTSDGKQLVSLLTKLSKSLEQPVDGEA